MNGILKLVLFGWGIEFGKYFTGGAPERWDYEMDDVLPAVPVHWSYGFGVHYRARYGATPQGWYRKWWYGKSHDLNSGPVLEKYREEVRERMEAMGL